MFVVPITGLCCDYSPLLPRSLGMPVHANRQLERGQRGQGPPPPIFFFLLKTFFLGEYWVEDGQIKIGVRMGERGVCVLRTGSNQPSPLFLTWLLIPIVDSPPSHAYTDSIRSPEHRYPWQWVNVRFVRRMVLAELWRMKDIYALITNLMHWLLFIHKILFFSTCFEHQVIIFRRT